METRTFTKGQKVTINGRVLVVVRVWKSGKVKLTDAQYPAMYTILSAHYLTEHGEF